jgi:hypothetical protein
MCQKTQTSDDTLLHTALVNMCYGKCTPEDISFLKTRIAGKHSDQPKVSAKYFRNVAIICGIHSQKDMINQLGCEHFAKETNQQLTDSYSIHKWGKDHDPALKNKWNKSKAANKLEHSQMKSILMNSWRYGKCIMVQLNIFLESFHYCMSWYVYNDQKQ